MVGIYKITNNVNGKVYIGQSIDIRSRFNSHKKALLKNAHNNKYLQDEWNTFGAGAFEFEVLKTCKSDKLNEYEKYFIKEYNATNKTCGFNIHTGNGKTLTPPPPPQVSFLDENNPLCIDCEQKCKQSENVEILMCSKLAKKR